MFWVDMVKNECAQHDYRTLRIDCISRRMSRWNELGFACWWKFRKLKSYFNDFWAHARFMQIALLFFGSFVQPCVVLIYFLKIPNPYYFVENFENTNQNSIMLRFQNLSPPLVWCSHPDTLLLLFAQYFIIVYTASEY